MRTATWGFDERYRAVESRDARFDGQFVTAVRSTGIYCRPSCPARTPKPSNVCFYPTSAAAQQAGYRACKRCLPEAAPGSPEWDLRGDVAARAMRLIAEGVVEREGVRGLAAHLGYSQRHLTRLLSSELGAGPLALARSQRAHTARLLLVNTDIPVSDVAFSAGFGSIRQCNATVREVFGMTPTELRARRKHSASAPGSLSLVLPVRTPFDVRGIFRWLSMRAIPGVERSNDHSFARTLRLPGGVASFEVSLDESALAHDADPGALRLRAEVTDLRDLGMLVARVRRLFDLDADPLAVDSALFKHPELASSIALNPGIRVPGATDPHEMLIRTMVGQQISVAAARSALTHICEQLGDRIEAREDGLDLMFPTMEEIAGRGHEVLRGPAARVGAIVDTATALADGSLTLTTGDDGAEQRAALLARPGIGPWTADYVRMRVLGDTDVVLPSDSAVRAGAANMGLPGTPRGLAEWAARVAPWRSYLTAHLWNASGSPSLRSATNKGDLDAQL